MDVYKEVCESSVSHYKFLESHVKHFFFSFQLKCFEELETKEGLRKISSKFIDMHLNGTQSSGINPLRPTSVKVYVLGLKYVVEFYAEEVAENFNKKRLEDKLSKWASTLHKRITRDNVLRKEVASGQFAPEVL